VTRPIFIVGSFVLGAVAAYFGHPFVRNNQDSLNVLVTVFTVLAGFLIAIIAVLCDPLSLSPRLVAESREPKRHGRKEVDSAYVVIRILFGNYWVDIFNHFAEGCRKCA